MGKYRRVAGTCHQGYPYFTDRFAGRQCTVIALVALAFAFMRAGQLWQTRDVDDIVREGHQRYIEIISFSNVGLRNLQHNEVPRFLHQFMGDADLDISVLPNSVYGIVGQEDKKASLKEILEKAGEVTIQDIVGMKVISTKEPVAYKNSTGTTSTMKEVYLADNTTFTKAIAYDPKKFPLLVENECVLVSNMIKKADGCLILTSQTNIFTTASDYVKVPDDLRIKALETKITTVLDATLSPKKTVLTIQGKVVQAEPSCRKRLGSTQEEVSFKKLKLKDSSGTVEIGLWRDMASTNVQHGDHVLLKNFYVTSRYHQTKHMHVPVLANQRKNSTIQFCPSTEENISSGDKSDEESNENQKKTASLVGVQSIYTYLACVNPRCNLKKLPTSLTCSSCSISYSTNSAGKGYVAKVLLEDDTGSFKLFTMFTEAMTGFLQSANIVNSANLHQDIKEQLTMKVSYLSDGDKLKLLEKIEQE